MSFGKEKIKFGDIFEADFLSNPCIVTAYFDDRNWWYVEKNSSRVLRAKFKPEDCKFVRVS